MRKFEELVEALEARKKGRWWMGRCPAHEDRTPSLGLRDNGDNEPFFMCFAGCTHSEVVEAIHADHKITMDRWITEKPYLITPIPDDAPKHALGLATKTGVPSAHYPYRDADGEYLMFKCRWDKPDGSKDFKPMTLWKNEIGELEWRFAAMPPPRPLFNLDQLAAHPDKPVLIVEGEKTASAASILFPSYVVTTWQDGAGTDKVKLANWGPLTDRMVTIWPDADAPGLKAAMAVALALNDVEAHSIRTVALPDGLPKGWDLADDLTDLGRPPEELLAEAHAAEDPTLARFVLTAGELAALDVPERKVIVFPWLPCAGLAMIFAKRGIGKTYLTLSLAVEVAKGGSNFLGHYHIPEARTVLYIDGELPLAELQTRMKAICSSPPDNLLLLSSEQMFRGEVHLNVHDSESQGEINKALHQLTKQGTRPELIVIDSLSTLSSGMDENDNTALDQLLKWLMELRHQGYTVLMIHHAGKGGDQRGASRREDLLDTSIKLDTPGADAPHDGAHFKLTFSKVRGPHPQPDEIECKLEPDLDGILRWTTQSTSHIPARVELLRAIFDNNPTSQKDLCNIVRRSKGAVSQQCKALKDKGELSNQGLSLTRNGELTLAQYYSDLNHLRQENIPF